MYLERREKMSSIAGVTVRRVAMTVAAALPPVASWTALTLLTLLLAFVLSLTVAYLAFKAIPPRFDNGLVASLLIAVALASTFTSCNSVLLIKDASLTAPYEIPELLGFGLVLISPALLLIWLGATLCVVFRRGGWWGTFGVLLIVAGLGLLLFLYSVLSQGGSMFM